MQTTPQVVAPPAPAGVAPTDRFDAPAVATVATAHFAHDLYPAFIGTLLPLLIDKHGMSIALAGGLATVLRWPSVAQPFLGFLADKTDARLLFIIPPVVTAVAISLLGPAPSYAAMFVLLLVAGLSSATFHPIAGAMATRASGSHWGRGSSFFMTGGELGRALGPVFIAAIIAAFGLMNTWVAAIPAVMVALIAARLFAGRNSRLPKAVSRGSLRDAIRGNGITLVLLGLVVLFRSLVIASFQVFFPTFLTQGGSPLVYAGLALSVYEIGGVAGAFLGGPISDRIGRRTMMAVSQLAAGPLLFFALASATQPIGLVLLAAGGLLALSAGPVQLTLIQELLPSHRSMASGIVMFLGFEGQVVATIMMGILADAVGLPDALRWSVLASMLSLPFTLLLPETRRSLRAGGH